MFSIYFWAIGGIKIYVADSARYPIADLELCKRIARDFAKYALTDNDVSNYVFVCKDNYSRELVYCTYMHDGEIVENNG